jgi:large subunit ribosomal protein L5
MKSMFHQHYNEVIRPALMEKGGYQNIHAVPRLEKIVVSMGLGRRSQEKPIVEAAVEGLRDITGQQPSMTYARKSIAGFKIREGMQLGAKVTLRGERMYEFFQRLIVIAMPRIRDFRGLSSRSFDRHGNFAMGIKEYHVFPEIKYDKVSDILGMNIVIGTSAPTDQEALLLLKEFGVPFYN